MSNPVPEVFHDPLAEWLKKNPNEFARCYAEAENTIRRDWQRGGGYWNGVSLSEVRRRVKTLARAIMEERYQTTQGQGETSESSDCN